MRATDHEITGRVDEILGVLGEHVFRQDLFDHLLDAEFLNLGVRHARRMLGGNHHIDDAGRPAIDIFDRNLRFSIRAQPLGEFASLANAGQFTAEAMREHDRCRHQLRSLVTSVTKHDALVARTLLPGFLACRLLRIHALGDVRRLGGQVVVDENLVSVEHIVVVRVADAAHRVTNHLLDVDHRSDRLLTNFRNGDFTAHDHHIALHKGFAGHAAFGIDREAGVENCVGNRVANFVRMTFANGFGGKNVGAHVLC